VRSLAEGYPAEANQIRTRFWECHLTRRPQSHGLVEERTMSGLSNQHRLRVPSAVAVSATPISRAYITRRARSSLASSAMPGREVGSGARNRAVRPHGVCYAHGAKAIEVRKEIAAVPMTASRRLPEKRKRQIYRQEAQRRAAGLAAQTVHLQTTIFRPVQG
jgi:hypothetical protein